MNELSRSKIVSESFQKYIPPKIAGSYVINDYLYIEMTNKPNAFYRFFTKLLLGWEWKDKT